ncbi:MULTISPECIES: oligosaccharide flippase family protein [unclassified Cellulophaga]|uniref:oligosaccharide flippase family protein n=1 Tax=unclassified Cellulophaga TaxID=2634405 RepID=UPI000C2C07A5|nr:MULTISPECIES: oligosaccharide flippase family protein [unclassified Cellulophaga]MDO6489797.1 oligosaccharide flippase family protein [Cellulophaga sp. 2_MG-2023]MDO6495009.1 oligosaccharide flippase family protein [Cellulophaga sp. 3_MG-2023]PKB42573.1 O-antigen/teichoic acid export membrane protein [Cellulophaga sp. RHA19]
MNPFKKLFKQTFVYGLATVLPRMLSFLLVRVYTDVMDPDIYGQVSVIFAWFAIFNVFLAYGMETAFFRFYHKSEDKEKVISTSLISIAVSTLAFFVIALILKNPLASFAGIREEFISYAIFILVLDALVIIPFAWLRATEKPMKYAIIKIVNICINLGLNLFFLLLLPKLVVGNTDSILTSIYKEDFQISYIFISNLIASGVTLILMLGLYLKSKYVFDKVLWRSMMKYAGPVLLAGIAFTINEVFDKILLEWLLPEDIAESEVGKYAACYKLALFMTLFATAFRMGIEPFFFSHSNSKNPQKAYAQITNYFVILGSVILLGVVVFADVLKLMFVDNSEYWEAMKVVPLIVLANFFLGIYHNLSVWYKVTDKTRYGAFISVIGAIVTIVVNVALISTLSYMASAIATVLAYGSMMVLSYWYGKKNYPIPYNMRKIVFYFSLSVVLSILSFYIFDRNLWVGCAFLLLFVGLVYKMENEVLRKIIKKK